MTSIQFELMEMDIRSVAPSQQACHLSPRSWIYLHPCGCFATNWQTNATQHTVSGFLRVSKCERRTVNDDQTDRDDAETQNQASDLDAPNGNYQTARRDHENHRRLEPEQPGESPIVEEKTGHGIGLDKFDLTIRRLRLQQKHGHQPVQGAGEHEESHLGPE